MNEKQFQKALGRLAEELVPENADLWPAIRDHFETSKHPTIQGDHSMNQALARRRLAAGSLLALLLVAALLFATPQGRALAQGIVNFFTHAESDRLPVQPWPLTPLPTRSGPDPSHIIDAYHPAEKSSRVPSPSTSAHAVQRACSRSCVSQFFSHEVPWPSRFLHQATSLG